MNYMERATGRDLDGDGAVAGKSPASAGRPPASAAVHRESSTMGSGSASAHLRRFSALAQGSPSAVSTWSQGQMPSEGSCIKTGVLDKQTLNLQWKARFVAINTEKMFFSRSDKQHVVDMIVLEDVKGIEAVAVADSDADSDGPPKLVVCQSILQHANSFREHLHPKSHHDTASGLPPNSSQESLGAGHHGDTDAEDKHKWLQNHVSKQEARTCFEIHTHDGGFNNGRSYMLKAGSTEARDEWIQALQTAIQTGKEERERARYRSFPLRLQRDLRRAYHSRPAQVRRDSYLSRWQVSQGTGSGPGSLGSGQPCTCGR